MQRFDNIINHQRNQNITFDKAFHSYIFEGNKFDGVTGWIDEYTEPFDRDKISKKLSFIWNRPQEEILKEWDDAREYGNYVHTCVELWVNEGLDIDVSEIVQLKELLKQLKLTPVIAEWVVYDEDIERASAIDLLCQNKDGLYVIIDLKTMEKPIKFSGYKNKKMKSPLNDLPDAKYYKQSLQNNIYQKWLKEKYEIELTDIHYTIQLRDNICKPIVIIDLQDKVNLMYKDLLKVA